MKHAEAEDLIAYLLRKAGNADPGDAQKLTQAALNVAKTILVCKDIRKPDMTGY